MGGFTSFRLSGLQPGLSGAVYVAISRSIKESVYIFETISAEKVFLKNTIKLKTGYVFHY
jgi:hypothetical protein